MPSPDAARLVAHLDLTDLRPGLNDAAIERLVERAASPLGPVAGICVRPAAVAALRSALDEARLPVRLVAVAGFPSGGMDADAALEELRGAKGDGADEIDLLYPHRAAIAGDRAPLELVRRAAEEVGFLKVILESSAWDDPAALLATAREVLAAGARMLKTGSGSTSIPAVRLADVELLAEAAAEHGTAGVKVSGGVNAELAGRSLAIAQRRFGADVGPERFRIGASRLLDELEGRQPAGDGY